MIHSPNEVSLRSSTLVEISNQDSRSPPVRAASKAHRGPTEGGLPQKLDRSSDGAGQPGDVVDPRQRGVATPQRSPYRPGMEIRSAHPDSRLRGVNQNEPRSRKRRCPRSRTLQKNRSGRQRRNEVRVPDQLHPEPVRREAVTSELLLDHVTQYTNLEDISSGHLKRMVSA